MKIIRTVLGDIPADQIGATDAHDHLIISGGPEIDVYKRQDLQLLTYPESYH